MARGFEISGTRAFDEHFFNGLLVLYALLLASKTTVGGFMETLVSILKITIAILELIVLISEFR